MKKVLLTLSLLLVAALFALPAMAAETANTEANIAFKPGALTLLVPTNQDSDQAMNLDFGINELPMDPDTQYPAIPAGNKPYAIYVEDTRGNTGNGWRLQAAIDDFSTADATPHSFPASVHFAGGVADALYPLSSEETAALAVTDMDLLSLSHSGLGAGAGSLAYANVATADADVRRNLFYLRWDVPADAATIDLQMDDQYDLRELVPGEEYTATIHWVLNEKMEVNP